MDSLIHLFHIIVTYPILNVIIWIYLRVPNFALTIIILACANTICFSWPARYLSARHEIIQNRLKQMLNPMMQDIQKRYAKDPVALRYAIETFRKEYSPNFIYRMIYVKMPLLLSLISMYIGFGTWFALAVLGGSSLRELNDVLYPFQSHLPALPDYSFTFLGQTASLVKRGVPQVLLIGAILSILVNNFILKKPPKLLQLSLYGLPQRIMSGTRLGCALFNGVVAAFLLVGFALIWAWIFAAGTLLIAITDGVLGAVATLFLASLRRIGILQKEQ